MSQPLEKKNKFRQTLSGGQDEEYDTYLFWPSQSTRHASGPGDARSSPLYGPVSIDSESTEYDYSELSSGPPSPITFAHTREFSSQFPTELDFGAAPSDAPEGGVKEEGGAEAEPPKEHITAKYSPIFKLGFYLSQMTQVITRAIDGVKIKTGKPRSQTP